MTAVEALALRLVELLEGRAREGISNEFMAPGVHELCVQIKRVTADEVIDLRHVHHPQHS